MPKPTPEERAHLMKDPGWRAVLIIFETAFAEHKGIWSFVDPARAEIDWRVLESGWSHGEQLLLHSAKSLYNGSVSLALDDIVAVLDESSFAIFIEAMKHARSNVSPEPRPRRPPLVAVKS